MAAQVVQRFRQRELKLVLEASGRKPLRSTPKLPNPFLPRKNPDTGRWAPAKYSLRQQADLVKKARQSNLVHLLPPGPKLSLAELQKAQEQAATTPSSHKTGEDSEAFLRKIEWIGEVKEKVVPGADIGNRLYAAKKRMFKGHKWERTMEKRENKRKILMKSMPARIQRFKSVRRVTLLPIMR